MSGVCRDAKQDLLVVAKDLERYRDLLELWLNGDERTTVMLGGTAVPSIRKLVHDIDERNSQGAQAVVDEGIQGMYVIKELTDDIRKDVLKLKQDIEAKIQTIRTMTATATKLNPGQQPTAYLDTAKNQLQFGIPEGLKGDKGDTGLTGPMPNHQWNGTRLQFQTSTGAWGDVVNLLGATGAQGPQGPPGTCATEVIEIIDCGGAYPPQTLVNIDGGKANSEY